MGPDMEQKCENVRQQIAVMADIVRDLMTEPELNDMPEGGDSGEARANIMLAYRHLEDARMRVGKVMQQLQGGVSKYDK